ncbi:MAG: putative baseplate assembly protein [Frankiales bacterium]|nr:putative baseplate assembly protein [Frankiales bacterium]
MALPAPNLDDRRFQDIVDEAKRLIPTYCPEWTNHNVSDPGVALIELFAWMSETVLYRLNQVPDRLYVHFLNLVGIEPFPPSVARAELTFMLSAVLDQAVTVPAGTEVTTAGVSDRETVVFTTSEPLVIAPPVLHAALTSPGGEAERYTDVWPDMRFDGASVTCFPSSPLVQGDALYLGFEHSLKGVALRLSVQASAEGIGVDPRNPPLAWELWSGEVWLSVPVYEDSTGGLNRDGNVVLLLPQAHEPLTLAGTRAFWLRARLVAPRPGQPTYQASPKIRRISAAAIGGSVPAEHAVPVGQEVLGRSNGRASQSFTVARTPILPRSADEVIRVIDLDGAVDWQEVSDFSESGPDDRHVVWDAATGVVRFGPRVRYADGSTRQHGAVPRDGAEIVMSGYRYGGGAGGNVGAQTLTVLRSTLPFIDVVTNRLPATGGVDAESVADAKERGPLSLRTGQRAVTHGDFERLTREASIEVARTRCLPSARPGGPVRVLVVPHLRSSPETHQLDDYALAEPLLARITQELDSRRLVGATVEVGTPFYQGLSVAALVRALPGRPAASVQQRAVDALARYVNPLTGGPEGNGWPFDTDLNSAALAQLLESVEGIERVDEVLLYEFDLRTGRRLGVGRDLIRLDTDSLFLSARHQVVVR